MIKVNEVINSERIIRTQCYQFPKLKYKEDLWLLRYLQDKNTSKESSFMIWSNIYKHKFDYELTNEELRPIFDKMWTQAKNKPLFIGHPIYIFQSELDFINKTETLPWIKELMIMLLGYFKFMDYNKLFLGFLPIKDLIPLTSLHRRRSGSDNIMYTKAMQAQLINIDEKFYASFPYMCKSGVVAKEIDTTADIEELAKIVTNFKVCPICGKTFEYNSKTKRDICIDCWRHHEVTKATARRKSRCSGENVNPYI